MISFDKPSAESKKILNSIPELINKTFPIPGRFRGALPSDIAKLSRMLTNSRGERPLSYLGRPNYLSAYLHYFLPWNLYRLCILLPPLNIKLSAGAIITDLGCGPLTFTSALWITRPDLRAVPLEFNCVDRVLPVMESGKKFFNALCESADSENSRAWKINIIKKDFNINKNASGTDRRNASLVCAVNVFNEQYDRIPHNNTTALRDTAKNAALFMHGEASAKASILTVEPGVPQSGRFITFLREAFIELGCPPLSPCPHLTDCPLMHKQSRHAGKQQTNKKRWCHFAYETADAPKELQRLSAAAKLPKDRLAFSYLLTGGEVSRDPSDIRVISDAFPLPGGRFGCYGCSAKGLVLLTGEKKLIEKAGSGSLLEQGGNSSFSFTVTGERDQKSGAVITELK